MGAKREAGIEPQPAEPYLAGYSYPYAGYPYNYGYNPYYNVVKPAEDTVTKTVEEKEAVGSPVVYNYGHPYSPYSLPYGLHPYTATHLPTHYITKREAEAEPTAEAEADPYLIYGNY